MKLSLKVEYACRVLAQLGRRYDNAQLAHIDDLAESEAIPANYLVQILNELRNGGLIISRRGKQGGYALSRSPKAISLYEVVRVIDVEMIDSQVGVSGQSGEKVSGIWARVSNVFEAEIQKYTLSDFMPDESAEMYYI